MKLDGPAIANVARTAGFTNGQLHEAIAVALASSGGLTHYRHTHHMPGTGDERGLWAVDIDRYPEWSGADLYDPQTAAHAAYALTTAWDGFDWSPVAGAGTHVPYLHVAAVDSTRLHAPQLPGGNVTPLAGNEHIDDVLATARRLTATIRNRPGPGELAWHRRTR